MFRHQIHLINQHAIRWWFLPVNLLEGHQNNLLDNL
jgi:hypothetical protein